MESSMGSDLGTGRGTGPGTDPQFKNPNRPMATVTKSSHRVV